MEKFNPALARSVPALILLAEITATSTVMGRLERGFAGQMAALGVFFLAKSTWIFRQINCLSWSDPVGF
ncbi:hypothetical protein [Elongatibacter sediminis]|uniref:Uncharacterized protein n=1 Tax=Elongatibacter sediminis TaxID=3119006 RepID=A0AAW9R9W4_9GAMM